MNIATIRTVFFLIGATSTVIVVNVNDMTMALAGVISSGVSFV